MGVEGRLGLWRATRVIDPQQILGRADRRHGPDFRDLCCAWRAAALGTEGEQPDPAGCFGRECRIACGS